MEKTRALLERIPDDKLDWKAHPKSNTIGWNANHLADLPELARGRRPDSQPVASTSRRPAASVTRSPSLTSRQGNPRPLRPEPGQPQGEKPSSAVEGRGPERRTWTAPARRRTRDRRRCPAPRSYRSVVMNHIIRRYRAILCVYLRLNDIPVPGMHGPSGDEQSGTLSRVN